jgi:hypothetical protein
MTACAITTPTLIELASSRSLGRQIRGVSNMTRAAAAGPRWRLRNGRSQVLDLSGVVRRIMWTRHEDLMHARKGKRHLLLVTTALLACSSPMEYEAGPPQPGVLQLLEYPAAPDDKNSGIHWSPEPDGQVLVAPQAISAPDTVTAGTAFDVITTTIGLNGCWSAGGQTVQIMEHLVEIKPRDIHSGASVCTEILLFLPHTSTLQLPAPGQWLLRVHGRRISQQRSALEEPVIAEKIVVVR